MSWTMAGAIFLGGGIGALARFGVGGVVGHWLGTAFPWGTLVVNLVGCLAMGLLVGLFALAWSPGPAGRAFLTVGLLGGFTTFSAFAADAVLLLDRGQELAAAAYVAASALGCVAAALVGLRLVRMAVA